jgi:hypothetical protein
MIYKILYDEFRATTESRYSIAKKTGVPEPVLCRLYNLQAGCSVQSAEALLNYFGYEIVKRKAKK